ncbi:HRDC domain-containing protein [Haliscomenobacter sp.]|uniref:HRDC domain-containing protein n=1 Tax=Haliscomenobacter sp. TaxID=2717303 RepID=UPI003364E1E8
MQLKVFTIPIIGGESINEELNRFLRAKKVIKLEKQLTVLGTEAFWCCCVSYIDDPSGAFKDKAKVDYRLVLDEASFARFSLMREIRKQISVAEGIPAYNVFTDEELAGIATLEKITLAAMRSIKGIGEKKVEKYGAHFIPKPDEKS